MHACGHDAQVTWLLGFAKTMAALKDRWSGTLLAYGQPAEEVGLGAQAMVEDNLWNRGVPRPILPSAFTPHLARSATSRARPAFARQGPTRSA